MPYTSTYSGHRFGSQDEGCLERMIYLRSVQSGGRIAENMHSIYPQLDEIGT